MGNIQRKKMGVQGLNESNYIQQVIGVHQIVIISHEKCTTISFF